jgi:CRP-like cAMP-binding protein
VIPISDLRKVEIFAELDPADLTLLAKIAEATHANEGEILIQAGLPARTLYVLQQGNLMVAFPDGRAITLHEPGGVVGWSALVNPTRYTASVICLTDCALVSFAGAELLRLVQRSVAMGTKIMRNISELMQKRLPFMQEEDRRRLNSVR